MTVVLFHQFFEKKEEEISIKIYKMLPYITFAHGIYELMFLNISAFRFLKTLFLKSYFLYLKFSKNHEILGEFKCYQPLFVY